MMPPKNAKIIATKKEIDEFLGIFISCTSSMTEEILENTLPS